MTDFVGAGNLVDVTVYSSVTPYFVTGLGNLVDLTLFYGSYVNIDQFGKTHLMLGYAPELAGFVQWTSIGSADYNPTTTTPSCVVENLINKTAWMVS